jgi:hypothetical protein
VKNVGAKPGWCEGSGVDNLESGFVSEDPALLLFQIPLLLLDQFLP